MAKRASAKATNSARSPMMGNITTSATPGTVVATEAEIAFSCRAM
jgi:hypothetical protein